MELYKIGLSFIWNSTQELELFLTIKINEDRTLKITTMWYTQEPWFNSGSKP